MAAIDVEMMQQTPAPVNNSGSQNVELPADADRVSWSGFVYPELMLLLGAAWLPFIGANLLGVVGQIAFSLGTLVVAFGTVGVAGYAVFTHRKRVKPSCNIDSRGGISRLSMIAPSAKLKSDVSAWNTGHFEPVVLRTLPFIQFSEYDATTGYPAHRLKKTRKGVFRQPIMSRHQSWADWLVVLVGVVTVYALERTSTGKWSGHGSITIFAGLALGIFMLAFVKPAYLRIAPGSLDVFSYRPFGIGAPRVVRYDLRTAEVMVDEPSGWVAVIDPARPSQQVVYIRPRWVWSRTHTAAVILAAARSPEPTPPLPMDALSG